MFHYSFRVQNELCDVTFLLYWKNWRERKIDAEGNSFNEKSNQSSWLLSPLPVVLTKKQRFMKVKQEKCSVIRNSCLQLQQFRSVPITGAFIFYEIIRKFSSVNSLTFPWPSTWFKHLKRKKLNSPKERNISPMKYWEIIINIQPWFRPIDNYGSWEHTSKRELVFQAQLDNWLRCYQKPKLKTIIFRI